jgi:hypothetical protein
MSATNSASWIKTGSGACTTFCHSRVRAVYVMACWHLRMAVPRLAG